MKVAVVLHARLEKCRETDKFGFKQKKKKYKNSLELRSIRLFLSVLVGLIESKWTQGLKGWSFWIITSRLSLIPQTVDSVCYSKTNILGMAHRDEPLSHTFGFSCNFFFLKKCLSTSVGGTQNSFWSLFWVEQVWCRKERKGRRDGASRKKNKILKNQIKIRSNPAPSTCSLLQKLFFLPTSPFPHKAPSSVSSFCCLIPPTPLLPPVSIPSVSLFLSLHDQTGRDRETVVVLAVWHYQLINPCQQLVPPPTLPPLGQKWRNPVTHQ